MADTSTADSSFVNFLRVSAPIASQIVFLAPLSTMRKITIERTCGKISPVPFSAMVVSGMVWASYGLLKREASIWASNLSAIGFGCYYVSVFMRHLEDKSIMKSHFICGCSVLALVALCALGLSTESALQALGLVGTALVVMMFGGPLAAIQTVVRERSTNSIPPAFTLASLVNCLLWAGLGWSLADPFVWFPNVLGLLSSLAQLGLFAVYGWPTRAAKDPRDGAEMAA